MTQPSFCGLPVVAFEDLVTQYHPEHYALFIALSFVKLNALRKEKYLSAKAMGYHLASYISTRAIVLNDGNIGENCFIPSHAVLQPFATIGNNVFLSNATNIGHHAIVKDHCFIGTQAIISDGVEVGEQCFIGSNATLSHYIKIGARCVVGANTLILRDALPEGIYKATATPRAKLPSTKLREI